MSNLIYAKDHGIYPDTGVSTLKEINKLIASADEDSEIVFETGHYILSYEDCERRVIYIPNTTSESELKDKTKNIGLYFGGKKNIVFNGNNSFFEVVGEMIIVMCEECENISFRNFFTDYRHATVGELQIDKLKFDCLEGTINKNSDYEVRDGKLYWKGENFEYRDDNFVSQLCDRNNGKTWRTYFSPTASCLKVEEIEPYRIRVRHFKRVPIDRVRVGYTYQLRKETRSQVGVYLVRSENISMSHIDIGFMHGLGIVGQYSGNLSFDNMRLCPLTGNHRTTACFADFMHFVGCHGNITVKDSYFNGSHDDVINVHGVHMVISEKLSDKKVVAEFMHRQAYGFDVFYEGDEVEGVDKDKLTMLWRNTVKSAKLIDKKHIMIEFETPYEGIKTGQALENVTATPSLTVEGNTFEHIPTRGILVTTRRKVEIRNNVFNKTGMSAVLVSDDARTWYESGRVTDVTIEGNTFNRCAFYNHAPVIHVLPENINPMHIVHRNITVRNNKFILHKTTAISAKSTADITIGGNEYEGFIGVRPLYSFTACTGVKIEKEECRTNNRKMRLFLMDKKEVENV